MSLAAALHASVASLGYVAAWPEFGWLIAGVFVGALVGILPGLGGPAALAMCLPLTMSLPVSQAFALLMGVAAVVATTGDLTSILVGIPGEAISAATVIDGHAMAARGEGARAIGASLFSSLAGSIFGALTLALTAPLALRLARAVGSPELFMLALLGISFMAPMAGASRVKGLAAGALGLMLATVGLDPLTSTPRFTFGQLSLWDGISPIAAALGLFAIPEIVGLSGMQAAALGTPPPTEPGKTGLVAGMRDVGRLWSVTLLGSAIGALGGLLPGMGASASQWLAYARVSRRRPEGRAFGQGAIEGVIAPSAANNATLGGSLVPALALGIPGGLLSAMLLSALIMKGLAPGPAMLAPETEGGHLTLVFALVWFLVIGNVVATALAWVSADRLLQISSLPSARIVPFLLLMTFVGAFTERHALSDLVIMGAMGVLGLTLVRLGWPRAPLLLGLVLGTLAENRFFVSMDAYGATWLGRPGVWLIGAVLVGGLLRPRRSAVSAERPASSARHAGELFFGGGLVVLLATAVVAASSYSPRAALFPRAIAMIAIALVIAACTLARRTDASSDRSVDGFTGGGPAAFWIPVFLFAIVTLGFVIGAPLVVGGYLILAGRQSPMVAALSAGATCAFLYLVLFRLLGVRFPSGMLVAWAAGL